MDILRINTQIIIDLLYVNEMDEMIDNIFVMATAAGLSDSSVIGDIKVINDDGVERIVIDHSRVRGIGYTKKNYARFKEFMLSWCKEHGHIDEEIWKTPAEIIAGVLEKYVNVEQMDKAEECVAALIAAGYNLELNP